MASRRQRDEWADFVRLLAEDLRGCVVRQLGRPTVRRWVRACGWTVFGCFFAAFAAAVAAFSVAMWYEYRKHDLAGVPWHHRADRFDGQPAYVARGGGPLKNRVKTPLTEEQFQAWEENGNEGRKWALRGRVC